MMTTGDGWLDDETWAEVEGLVPITCVDALPWRRTPSGGTEICLIKRADEAGAGRLNLVGGRVRRNELLADAVARHVRETLGDSVAWDRSDFSRPEYAGQYLTHRSEGVGFDPRHHAIALSYTLEITGSPTPRGEAQAVRFFPLEDLPPENAIGFAQHHVVSALAARLRTAAR